MSLFGWLISFYNAQPYELWQNLLELVGFRVVVDTATAMFFFYKNQDFKKKNAILLKAAKLQKTAGTGVDRNQRRYEIITKYMDMMLLRNMKNAPPGPLQMMQQVVQGQGQVQQQNIPQMPQFDMLSMAMRFGPTMLFKMYFSEKSTPVLYVPLLAKLSKQDDTIMKFFIMGTQFGKQSDETYKPGYVSRFFFNLVFGKVFRAVINKIMLGKPYKPGFAKNLELQALKAKYGGNGYVRKGEQICLKGNEDLKLLFPDIDEISEVQEPLEDAENSNSSSNSNSNSKF